MEIRGCVSVRVYSKQFALQSGGSDGGGSAKLAGCSSVRSAWSGHPPPTTATETTATTRAVSGSRSSSLTRRLTCKRGRLALSPHFHFPFHRRLPPATHVPRLTRIVLYRRTSSQSNKRPASSSSSLPHSPVCKQQACDGGKTGHRCRQVSDRRTDEIRCLRRHMKRRKEVAVGGCCHNRAVTRSQKSAAAGEGERESEWKR